MSSPGIAPQPDIAPGAALYNKMLSAGAPADQANAWRDGLRQKMLSSGAPIDQVQAYWGGKAADSSAIDALHEANPAIHEATNPLEALVAGLQMSDAGLAIHGKPTTVLPEHAGLWNQLLQALGQTVPDLPVMALGAAAGAPVGVAAGAAVPGVGETGVSEAIGGAMGMGAGANALPQAIREVLLDGYNKGQNRTWGDFWSDVAGSTWRIAKSGAIGAATLGVGKGITGPLAERLVDAGVKPFLAKGADLAAQATVATTVGGALDGKVPNANDFVTNAVTMLGLHAAGRMVGTGGGQRFEPNDAGKRVEANLQDIYRRTGIAPWKAVQMARTNPSFKNEILAQDVNGQPVTPNMNSSALDEPPRPGQKQEPALSFKDPVEELLPKVRGLEASGDDAISPAGAIGRYQIMPGTARQYMGSDFDISSLKDPVTNERVARTILTELNRRFRGDQDAILAAYNAGPGRAAQLIKAGPGTRLDAVHTPHGWVYQRVASPRSEAGLPLETQEYLARGRAGGGGGVPPAGGGGEGGGRPPQLEGPEGEDPFKLATESRVSRYLDRVGEPSTASRPFQTGLEMDLDAARRVDGEMKLRGLLDPATDISITDMARSTYASENRADHFFQRGPMDPITFEAKPGPSLKDVADQIKEIGGNKDEFNAYRVSLRTIEKAQQGIKVGVIPLKEAEANAADPNLQKYADANKTMQLWKRGVLEYVRDSGGISQKQLDAMEAANTSHVSLRRLMGDDTAFKGPMGRKGFRAVNPIARMEGSDKKIIDPWLADIDNARMMIRFADRNRAAGAVVGAQQGIPAAESVRRLRGDEAKATLAEPGSNVFKPYGMTDKEEEAFRPFVEPANGNKKEGSTRFTFWRDGKPEVYETTDPNLARLYRAADTPGEAILVTKIAQLPAKMARAGIASDPTFGLRVGLKHQTTAFIADPMHPPPFITMLGGVMDVFGKSDAYWDFVRHGGLSGSITDMDKTLLQSDTQKLLEDTGVNAKLWNLVKHPIELSQMLTDRIAQSSRMGYWKRATAQGVDPFKAAMMARSAYLDYDEGFVHGAVQTWAKFVPFFKADILGIRQGGAALWGAKKAINTAAYVGLGVVLPSIALYAANRWADKNLPTGQKYTDLPQWERDNYFITPPIMGQRFRLGKPYNFGPLIGIPLERFLEHQFENDPHAFDSILKNMAQPVPLSLPPVVNPILEGITNHSFFTGKALVPDSLKDASGDLQYTEATTAPAIALAHALGSHGGANLADVSPIILENYVRAWTGSVGMTVLKAVGMPFQQSGKPWEMSDLPFVNSFFVRNPGAGAKPIEDFYTDMKKLEEAHANTFIGLKRGDPQIIAQDAANGNLYTRLDTMRQALGIMRTSLQGINDDKAMTREEKLQNTDRIVGDMIGIATAGSKIMQSVNP